MESKEIVEYAAKRGWYNPARDGEFDLGGAYGGLRAYVNRNNVFRR